MQQSPRPSERWILLIMWLGLLVALLYTSVNSRSILSFGWFSTFPTSLPQVLNTANTVPAAQYSVAVGHSQTLIMLIIFVVLVWQLLTAWLRFATLTLNLTIAYSRFDVEDAEKTIFAKLLTLPRPTSIEPRSSLADVLRPLAYVWIAILTAQVLPSLLFGLLK